MNEKVQAMIALNRRAIKEGTIRWQIPENIEHFQFEPLIIQQDGRDVGYALVLSLDEARAIATYRSLVIEIEKLFSSPQLLRTAFVAQVYVIPEARKSGTYRKLSDTFIGAMQARGLKHLVGGIKKWNEHSLKVHTRKGGFGWKIRSELGDGPEGWIIVSKDI